MTHYTFQYSLQDDCGPNFPIAKTAQTSVQFHDEATWDVVLNEFISFLSSVYGYDISQSVHFESLEEKLAKTREKYNLDEEDTEEDEEDWRKIL